MPPLHLRRRSAIRPASPPPSTSGSTSRAPCTTAIACRRSTPTRTRRSSTRRASRCGTIPGRRSPEQQDAEAAQHKAEERARETAAQAHQRDQNLLATYLSVEEIEALRDRRAEILDAQARVTSQYLDQLRVRQKQLEQQAAHFKPYNPAPNAVMLPERLAEDLVRTTSDIATQQRNLEVKRQELDKLKAQFDERHRALQGTEADRGGLQPQRRPRAQLGRAAQLRPELPKPPAPRSLAVNASTTSRRTCTTGTTTSCAIRSPGSIVKLAAPRFHTETISCPW